MTVLPSCHLCRGSLDERSAYGEFWRVTSDCRPFPPGGRLAVCRECGIIQKPADTQWHDETARIYAAYDIYHQAGGTEQAIFDPASGAPRTRSSRLVEFLAGRTDLPRAGRLLDVGCGNGALLRAASAEMSEWRFAGLELNDKYRDVVLQIRRVDRFYAARPGDVRERFDVVSLVHALEHVPEPAAFLREAVAPRLTPGGALFVEVPDVSQNPFDLLVADHATHFDTDSLIAVVEAGGFHVVEVRNDWVPKELTLLARPPQVEAPPGRVRTRASDGPFEQLEKIRRAVRDRRQSVGSSRPFGVFGTSIAATWVAAELGEQVDFFVDEDPARGRTPFMGRPVLRPSDVERGASVVVGLAPAVARQVAFRLSRERPEVTWWSPAGA